MADKLMKEVGRADELINCGGVGRVDKLAQGGVGRVDELIHTDMGNKLMHGVVGRMDDSIHCDGMTRVDKLTLRQCGESEQADTQ